MFQVAVYCGQPILYSQLTGFRTMLHVALAHVISNVPVTVILDNTKKVNLNINFFFCTFINSHLKTSLSVQLHPLILEGLSILSVDSAEKETLFSLLLVLSGTLTDTKGKKS